MDDSSRLAIYRAQTKNVKQLKRARVHLERSIKFALRQGNSISAEIHTKALVLVFCAWVEASFSKVVHTPHGFTTDEIEQIKGEYRSNGLEAGWLKCLELGLARIPSSTRSNYVPNVRKKIVGIVEQYVVEPSLLRNKIAHGQWEVALNRENSEVNSDLTKELAGLDVVRVAKWFDVNERLSLLIEVLIESPTRAFHRDYWTIISDLDDYLQRTKDWSLAEKIKRLKEKTSRGQSF